MNLKLQLQSASNTYTISDGLFSFVLEKERYTPYTQLTASFGCGYGITDLRQIRRVRFLANETELHCGTVEQFQLTRQKGRTFCQVSSRGLTAMLLQNQLEPGMHSAMSLDQLMTSITLPTGISWESNTDASNYLYVKENTSLWDGVANLTYKLCQQYPFIYGANQVRMHWPTAYQTFYPQESTLLASGMTLDHSRIYSDFYMADADGTYGTFHETDATAAEKGIVRTKQLALDRQYLYAPQQALIFRRKFAARRIQTYYFVYNGILEAELGDRMTVSDVLEQAPICRVRMSGDAKGVRTRLETYLDVFTEAETTA